MWEDLRETIIVLLYAAMMIIGAAFVLGVLFSIWGWFLNV